MKVDRICGLRFMNCHTDTVRPFIDRHRRTIKCVGMILSANLFGTVLGVVGSLVQAHFISPTDLGFVRKYSVVSGYAIFLSLGLFLILQREYPVLIGRGEEERARRVASIGQTWCALTSIVVCGGLLIVCLLELIRGNWREASAWFIQIVSVISILYGGYLHCTFRSGHEFERLAKGEFLGHIAGTIILPLFAIWPFFALVGRSIVSSIISLFYLNHVRPVRVGWCLPRKEFFDLVKRGIRLFIGSYLRYSFWPTVEIWLMLRFAGDKGVGLLVFSTMVVVTVGQVITAVNQIYMPRLALHYGQTGSLAACLRYSVRPTILNIVSAILISCVCWFALPPILVFAFPKYVPAIPLIRVLLADTILVALSLPLYMVAIQEDYITMTAGAVIGLSLFLGTTFYLQSFGLQEMSVIWGTIVGRFAFIVVGLASLMMGLNRNNRAAIVQSEL